MPSECIANSLMWCVNPVSPASFLPTPFLSSATCGSPVSTSHGAVYGLLIFLCVASSFWNLLFFHLPLTHLPTCTLCLTYLLLSLEGSAQVSPPPDGLRPLHLCVPCTFPDLLWRLEFIITASFCCCSVTKSCLTLCDPVDYSMPGSLVLHFILEFARIRAHWVGDATQLYNT